MFSTHAVKAIITGEGGIITTNDENLALRLKKLRSHGVVRDKDSGKGHEVLKIMNLAKIMAWLWYGVGHGDGHEFGCDHGQDI